MIADCLVLKRKRQLPPEDVGLVVTSVLPGVDPSYMLFVGSKSTICSIPICH